MKTDLQELRRLPWHSILVKVLLGIALASGAVSVVFYLEWLRGQAIIQSLKPHTYDVERFNAFNVDAMKMQAYQNLGRALHSGSYSKAFPKMSGNFNKVLAERPIWLSSYRDLTEATQIDPLPPFGVSYASSKSSVASIFGPSRKNSRRSSR